MSSTNKKKYNKVFTKVSGYSTWTFRPGKEKPMSHKDYNKKTRKDKICKNYHATRRRENPHILDRTIPNYIKQRIQVHYHTV